MFSGPSPYAAALFFLAPVAVLASEPSEPPFGFRALEIFRASDESLGLQALDLNGDSLTDLVYADNEDATIRLLLQVPPGAHSAKGAAGPAGAPASPALVTGATKRSINELPSDERFRVERFFTEKKVTGLGAADLNGDRLPDLAYYGDPKELEVVYQGGEWGSRREKFAITDGVEGQEALALSDLDGDGRSDLVLLGAGKTYIFRQRKEGGGLEKPQVIYNAYSDVSGVRVGDLDGDGRPDLVLLRPRASHPFLLRFQSPEEGRGFGPEIPLKSLPVHRTYLEKLEGAGPASLLAIQGNTRRVHALRWAKRKEALLPALSEPRLYAFRPEGDANARRVQLGDVNGDGRADLAVSSAETAELDIYLQTPRGELASPSPSPTLAEVKGIALGDLDGDGSPEVVVASAREKAIGVSRWLPVGRLSIPESHLVEGEPHLVAVGKLEGSTARLVTVHKSLDGKFHLSVRGLTPDRGLVTSLDLPFDSGAEPNGLVLFDADGDGRLDAMVFIPYEDPLLYMQEGMAGGEIKFREASRGKDFGLGQITRLTPAAFGLTDALIPRTSAAPSPLPSGQVMLVAQKSFARALVLDPRGRLSVLEQFAGRGAAAEIQGVSALNLDGDPEKEVLLFDKAESAIDILDRNPQGLYRLARSISMPGFEFAGFRTLDLNGDGLDDAALLGKQAVAVLYQGGQELELLEFARFDTEDKPPGAAQRGLPDHLAVGDLNADGVRDLVLSTDPLYLLNFLSPEGTPEAGSPEAGPTLGKLRSRLSFPIFEEKSFMRRQGGHGPRELVAADVTGDKKTDLVILIHDRILLYPQE